MVLIDVRDPYEFDAGHIDGAHLYPWNSKLFIEQHTDFPAGYALALYCRTGNRSSHAADFMDTLANGIYKDKLYNLTTGITEWPFEVVTGGQDGPAVVAGPDTLQFGDAFTGAHGKTRPITLFNPDGPGAALLRVIIDEEQGFSVRDSVLVVNPGDSLMVTVSFQPLENIPYTDSALIFHGGVGRDTLAVVLLGEGVGQIQGDVNGTGKVDIFDLLDLLKVISGKVAADEPERFDMNDDGKTNIFDLLELLQLMKSGN